MSLKKFASAALAALIAGSTLVSCSQPIVANLPDFVDEVKVDEPAVQAPVDGNQKYMAYEIEFVSDKEYENPVYTVDMDVIFTNKDTGTSLKVPAFWNGGTDWKVRYSLTELGTWTWETVCTDESNAGLHGLSGEVKCVEYVGDLEIYKRGFLKTEDGTRYIMYADGTPFFYLGDTHWALPMESLDHYNNESSTTIPAISAEVAEYYGVESQFEYIMDYRWEQGFTVIQSQQLYAYERPLDFGAGLLNYGAERESFFGYDGKTILETGIDEKIIAQFNYLDKYFEYIAEKGFVHAHAQLGTYPIPFIDRYFKGVISDENLDKLCRYWVARYCAYPVIWTTGQEVDNDHLAGLDNGSTCPSPEENPWRLVMESVASYDPYDHPSTAHSEHTQYTQVEESSFDELKSHSFYASQWSPDMDANPAKDAGEKSILDWEMLKEYWNNPYQRAVIYFEGGYDHHWSGPLRTRIQGWASFLNGQFGFGYGAQPIWALQWGNGDAQGEPLRSDDYEEFWRDLNWIEGLALDGSDQLIYMKELLTQYEWWKLEPVFNGNEYFSTKSGYEWVSGYCMATIENELYIGYFYTDKIAPYSYGTLTGMENGQYTLYWMDAESGYRTDVETVTITDGTYEVNTKPWRTDSVLVMQRVTE